MQQCAEVDYRSKNAGGRHDGHLSVPNGPMRTDSRTEGFERWVVGQSRLELPLGVGLLPSAVGEVADLPVLPLTSVDCTKLPSGIPSSTSAAHDPIIVLNVEPKVFCPQ